jgi:hypothetical protein
MMTAALLAQYAHDAPVAFRPEDEATLIMLPPPARRMDRMAALVPRNQANLPGETLPIHRIVLSFKHGDFGGLV